MYDGFRLSMESSDLQKNAHTLELVLGLTFIRKVILLLLTPTLADHAVKRDKISRA